LRYAAALVSVILTAWSLGRNAWAAPPSCTNENKAAAWDLLLAKEPKGPESFARDVELIRAECGLPLGFWAGPKAEKGQKKDHPCGEWVQAFVKVLPSPSDPVMQSEEVIELGPAGEAIQHWWAPIDTEIDGVSGDELLITEQFGDESPPVQLAIGPRGTFRVIPQSANPPGTSIPCPTSRDLPHSSYTECWKLSDKVTSAERRLAYEGPCS